MLSRVQTACTESIVTTYRFCDKEFVESLLSTAERFPENYRQCMQIARRLITRGMDETAAQVVLEYSLAAPNTERPMADSFVFLTVVEQAIRLSSSGLVQEAFRLVCAVARRYY